MNVTGVVLGASRVRLAHQRRGHVARAILDIEAAGDLDLLHFLTRRHRYPDAGARPSCLRRWRG